MPPPGPWGHNRQFSDTISGADGSLVVSTEKGLDILGIKPIAEAISKVTTGTIDGAAAFLGRICLPAAEEFGLLLRDRVHQWRAQNIAAITEKAKAKLAANAAPEDAHSHPRLVNSIIEQGSWIQDFEVQEMWAGLLASSCTESGDDESNLIFVTLLSRLTSLQVRVLNFACENAQKYCSSNGLIGVSEDLVVTNDVLLSLTDETDVQRLDRELDYLRSVDLLQGGFEQDDLQLNAHLTPTSLAIHLYVRAQGSRRSPIDYFQLSPQPAEPGIPPPSEQA